MDEFRVPDQAKLSERFSDETLQARKSAGYVHVTDEQLMDAGLIPDTRPAPVPPPLKMRLRMRIALWRIRLGEIVAGQRFDEF